MTTHTTDTATYKMIHTMIRVKDPKRSIEFYNILGLQQINQLDIADEGFSLYYLAYNGPGSVSRDRHWTDRSGVIELTHHYGSENDQMFHVSNGNTGPHFGFGHIAITVDNVKAACDRLHQAGLPFTKELTEGNMKDVAIVQDPDGYWIEISGLYGESTEPASTDISTYRQNHSLIRVKSPDISLKFYEQVLGMTLIHTFENVPEGFTLYSLAYHSTSSPLEKDARNPVAGWEGIVTLRWNYGTEKCEGKVYHDGNSVPTGFGHFCISVDDLDAACARFESLNVSWSKRLSDGSMNDMAFMLDPDGYWIELLQNEALKPRCFW